MYIVATGGSVTNVVNFDTMPTRRQPDFKKALSTLHRLKKSEDNAHYENWSHSFLLMVAMAHNLVGSPILRLHHKDGLNTVRTGKPVIISESSIHLWYESQQELNAKFIVNISVTADNSLLSPTGGVKTIPPDTAIHEQKWLRKSVYNDKYTFNTFETTVDNHKSDATHMDMRNMQN